MYYFFLLLLFIINFSVVMLVLQVVHKYFINKTQQSFFFSNSNSFPPKQKLKKQKFLEICLAHIIKMYIFFCFLFYVVSSLIWCHRHGVCIFYKVILCVYFATLIEYCWKQFRTYTLCSLEFDVLFVCFLCFTFVV